MKLIGENIHIISKLVREALVNHDELFVTQLVELQKHMDYIDLNVGPAKGQLENILPWLCSIVEKNSDLKISFDTTNAEEMKRGLSATKNADTAFINSTSIDEPRFSAMTDLALNYNCNLIALTMSNETGIPQTADERMEIAIEIYENALNKGISNNKLYFDPLILPLTVKQEQCLEALNTIRMIKESFDPPVNTIVGLSNVSNGAPNELRPLINRVFAVLAFGAGLDAAIIDAKDTELARILKMLDSGVPKLDIDNLYLNLSQTFKNFGELEDVKFDENSIIQQNIIKTAYILLNKKIYSHSFTQI